MPQAVDRHVLAVQAWAGLGRSRDVQGQPGRYGVVAHPGAGAGGKHEPVTGSGFRSEYSQDVNALAVQWRRAVLAAFPVAQDVWAPAEAVSYTHLTLPTIYSVSISVVAVS